MNKNTFFGDKYKMENKMFTINNIHGFLNMIISRNARVYKKAQNFNLVDKYNFRVEKEIKNLTAMKKLHNENFLDTIDANQINAGYLMFAYANEELCEKCHLYEQMILNNFGKAFARFEEVLKNDVNNTENPNRHRAIKSIDRILNKMKSRLIFTKINVQLDEIDDWVFEMVPELVLVYPSQSEIKHFDHFENESGLLNTLSKFISKIYFGIANKKYKGYFKKVPVDEEL
jgi:hypothetical protein